MHDLCPQNWTWYSYWPGTCGTLRSHNKIYKHGTKFNWDMKGRFVNCSDTPRSFIRTTIKFQWTIIIPDRRKATLRTKWTPIDPQCQCAFNDISPTCTMLCSAWIKHWTVTLVINYCMQTKPKDACPVHVVASNTCLTLSSYWFKFCAVHLSLSFEERLQVVGLGAIRFASVEDRFIRLTS